MSEYNIESNIIIDDVEAVCSNIQYLTKRINFEMEDIASFIRNEYFTKFYLDEKMNIRKEGEYGNKYLWLDTGFQAEDGKAIFISLLPEGEEYAGHYVGTAVTLSKKIGERYSQYKSTISKNQKMFFLKYQSMLPKRTTKHITDNFPQIKAEESNSAPTYKSIINADNSYKEYAPTVEPMDAHVMQVGETQGSMAIALKSIGLSMNTNSSTTVEADDLEEQEDLIPKKIPEWVLDLYDELLINTWRRPEGLDRYIKIIGARILKLIEQKKTEYYIMNKIKSVVINTGLIDKFGSDVLIYYKVNLSENCYKAYNVVMSKSELLTEDFAVADIKRELKPIQFNDEDIILKASLHDFDINYKSLAHIIDERTERFPNVYRSMKSDVLASKIKSALEIGLKLQQRDHNYAKPVYSTKQSGVSWYLPLHIHKSLSEAPELVMIIKKVDAFYQVKTILPYDDNIKDRITVMALYGNSW